MALFKRTTDSICVLERELADLESRRSRLQDALQKSEAEHAALFQERQEKLLF
jgi:hypothetical protein